MVSTGGQSRPSGPVLVTPSGDVVGSAAKPSDFVGGGGSSKKPTPAPTPPPPEKKVETPGQAVRTRAQELRDLRQVNRQAAIERASRQQNMTRLTDQDFDRLGVSRPTMTRATTEDLRLASPQKAEIVIRQPTSLQPVPTARERFREATQDRPISGTINFLLSEARRRAVRSDPSLTRVLGGETGQRVQTLGTTGLFFVPVVGGPLGLSFAAEGLATPTGRAETREVAGQFSERFGVSRKVSEPLFFAGEAGLGLLGTRSAVRDVARIGGRPRIVTGADARKVSSLELPTGESVFVFDVDARTTRSNLLGSRRFASNLRTEVQLGRPQTPLRIFKEGTKPQEAVTTTPFITRAIGSQRREGGQTMLGRRTGFGAIETGAIETGEFNLLSSRALGTTDLRRDAVRNVFDARAGPIRGARVIGLGASGTRGRISPTVSESFIFGGDQPFSLSRSANIEQTFGVRAARERPISIIRELSQKDLEFVPSRSSSLRGNVGLFQTQGNREDLARSLAIRQAETLAKTPLVPPVPQERVPLTLKTLTGQATGRSILGSPTQTAQTSTTTLRTPTRDLVALDTSITSDTGRQRNIMGTTQSSGQRSQQENIQLQGSSTGMNIIQSPRSRQDQGQIPRSRIEQVISQQSAQRQRFIPRQTNIPRVRLPPRRIPILFPIPRGTSPEIGGIRFPSSSDGPAFDVFVKRKGKYFKIADDLPLGRALRAGARRTKSTLAASFKVVADPFARTRRRDIAFRPDPDVFRNYRIKGGRKIPLVGEFIQKRGKRLSSGSEIFEIKRSKRRASIL